MEEVETNTDATAGSPPSPPHLFNNPTNFFKKNLAIHEGKVLLCLQLKMCLPPAPGM